MRTCIHLKVAFQLADIPTYYSVQTHRISRILEVEKHLANKHTPALLCMTILHFCEPALQGWFVVFLA
jgi:hypothetical protein